MTNPTETRVVPVEQTEEMPRNVLERVAFNLCVYGFDPEFVKANQAFAEAAYWEFAAALAAAPAAPDLSDPTVVHVNMLQGAIARLTPEQVKHLYPELFAPAPAPAAPAPEPVGYIHRHPDHSPEIRIGKWPTLYPADVEDGWTEQPVYATPPSAHEGGRHEPQS